MTAHEFRQSVAAEIVRDIGRDRLAYENLLIRESFAELEPQDIPVDSELYQSLLRINCPAHFDMRSDDYDTPALDAKLDSRARTGDFR